MSRSGLSPAILSRKSQLLDVSSTNCCMVLASGCRRTQMCGRLLDLSLSAAMASSTASWELGHACPSVLLPFPLSPSNSKLNSGSPGQ
ncbi:hypothetical protein AAFF_G00211050 [Aldrovandia affinis]|uniref:Uncharacterized protein n=1 Tax=Aldrovandia affinis TaxID=143900 RepID=A0AAD7SWI6_9TELE|nr:hypothetical protein AAFF_G00211050 [Aldrovandia affinis]